MSKNITIKEGGADKQFTVDKLKTNTVGGGTCLWVPEDETQLGTKSVSENGTYVASDDGYYGYSQFSVSGVGTATGRDPVTGQEKSVTVDPETGDLVETVIPSEIRVITPPTNPYGTYIDGQTIIKDGMVVKAYDATGADMGTVPISEVTINPTTAVYDSSTDPGGGTADSDLNTGLVMPFPFSATLVRIEETESYTITDTISCDAVTSWGGNYFIVASQVSNKNGTNKTVTKYKDGRPDRINEVTLTCSSQYTYENKTVYYYSTDNGTWNSQAPHAETQGNINLGAIAWTMIYGDITPAGSPQTITVSWTRPGDGKVLETSFEIIVQQSMGGATGGGGQAGDTGAGRND